MDAGSIVICIVIALVVGMLIGLIAALVERGKLKTVRQNDYAKEYVVKDSFQLTGSREHFLYSHIDKTERPRNNDKR